jgi:hypothetical protein
MPLISNPRTGEKYGEPNRCHHDKNRQELDKQEFGYSERRPFCSRKAKEPNKQTNQQKQKSPSQHVGVFLYPRASGVSGLPHRLARSGKQSGSLRAKMRPTPTQPHMGTTGCRNQGSESTQTDLPECSLGDVLVAREVLVPASPNALTPARHETARISAGLGKVVEAEREESECH